MFIKPQIDLDWKEPTIFRQTPVLTPQQKARNTRLRKKQFKLVDKIRKEIISEQFTNHVTHLYKAIDTRYESDVFQQESIYCDCGLVLEITKKMFEEKYGKEYKLVISAT